MENLLIVNANIVNESKQTQADVRIKAGRIDSIAKSLKPNSNEKIIEAGGKLLIPGMIDDQVHFREPGLTHKGEIQTESAAALAGGITSFMEMPNVNPATVTHEELQKKYQTAAEKSLANYSFYFGATNNNLEAIKTLNPRDACGLKIFMGASTGNMLVDDPDTLNKIFAHCPIQIVTHCEDTPTIQENLKNYQDKYGDNIPIEYHPLIRSEEACYRSSSYAIELAKKHGSRLHVLHLTTARELQQFTAGPLKDKKITAEACVHHLFFNSDDYSKLGNLIKCNPAIKTKADQKALLEAVKSNVIDVIATDHAPHTYEEKQGNYITAPAGLPLVQHALLSLLEHYHNGLFDIELIVHKTSHAPAELFNVKERGFIREGYWADLVLLDINKPTPVTKENILYKCGWSPFYQYTFRSSIDTTIINGKVAYSQGRISDPNIRGKKLEFNR